MQTTIKIDIPKAIERVLGGRPSPGHEKVTEEVLKSLDEIGVPLNDADRAYIGVQVLKWHKQQGASETLEQKEQSQWDRIRGVFSEAFGSDRWNMDIALTMRADTLSWFVMLIALGIEKQKADWKEHGGGRLDASEAASLSSWMMDLESLVDQVQRRLSTDAPSEDEVEKRKEMFKRHNCFGFWKTSYETMKLPDLIDQMKMKTDARCKLVARDLETLK